MELAIVGTRGIPAKYGGFETFAEEISVRLSEMGMNVSVQCEKTNDRNPVYKGVKLFYSSIDKSNHQLRYYYEGLIWAQKNADVAIVTGAGGAVFYFLKKFKKYIKITNTDGIESRRTKWSVFHRVFLKLCEHITAYRSDYLIADSINIRDYLLRTYKIPEKKVILIEYGASINNAYDPRILQEHSVEYRQFYMVICRIEPENNIRMIIEGYLKSNSGFPLIIIGNTNTRYGRSLKKNFDSERVKYFGAIYNKQIIKSLRFSCKAYIHGHSVGGTNPSLLEAMANRNPCICLDNVFNREVTNNTQLYFKTSGALAFQIKSLEKMREEEINELRQKALDRVTRFYNWRNIVDRYINLIKIASGE